MSIYHLAPTNVNNPIVIRPTVEQQHLTKCKVSEYKDLIAKQLEMTGECWVYKDKYTLHKKHEQINSRKRKAQQSDDIDSGSDQLDPSDTEECTYYGKTNLPNICILILITFFFVFKLVFHRTTESTLFSGKFGSNAIAKPGMKKRKFKLLMMKMMNMMKMA